MNQEIGTEWVARLRGGEYPQSTCYLGSDSGYCCLGVLSEMAVEAGVIQKRRKITPAGRDAGRFEYGDDENGWTDQFLPRAVVTWAGVDTPSPHVLRADTGHLDEQVSLAGLNDLGESFDGIAGIIEEHYLDQVPA